MKIWGNPEPGMYCIRHANKDLIVRKAFDKVRGGEYEVFIDGIFAAVAANPNYAKTKAIKLAERASRGVPVAPYGERHNGPHARVLEAVRDASEPPEACGSRNGLEASGEAPGTPGEAMIGRWYGSVLEVPRDESPDRDGEPGTPLGGVEFHVSGRLSMLPPDAIATIKAAVDLLREHGEVTCQVIVPNVISI